MRVALSRTGRFVGKLSIQIVPSVAASVLGGYLLAQLVPQHTATPAEKAAQAGKTTPVTVSANSAPVVNDKAPIRVTQQRRDGKAAEPLAEVKPVAPAEIKAAETKASEIKASEMKSAETRAVRAKPAAPATAATTTAAVASSAASAQLYTPEPYTPEPSTPQVASQPVLQAPRNVAVVAPAAAPAAALVPAPAASAPGVAAAPALSAPTIVAPIAAAPVTAAPANIGAPTSLSPVTVTARAPAMPPPDDEEDVPAQKAERGVAGHVFSATSTAAGTAANAIGNTVNWVFELPGKLINRDDHRPEPQQQASQPRRFM